MQRAAAMVSRCGLVLLAAPLASASKANPLGEVIQLMDDLAAKVTREGEVEAKAFSEYMEWCDDASKNAKFSIEDATKQKSELEARISGYSSDIEVASSKIEELAGAISTSEADVKDATLVREKEASDFAASEKELMETIDALGRAIGILEKERRLGCEGALVGECRGRCIGGGSRSNGLIRHRASVARSCVVS